MNNPLIYFDYNAAMPLRPCAFQKIQEILSLTGNPSSIHHFGRTLSMHIENARQQIATNLGTSPTEVIFTSGGTEANNLVLQSHDKMGYDILVSAIEHDSVLKNIDTAELIPVGHNGIVSLDALETLLQKKTKPTLISVMFANNETGVIQPLTEIVALSKRYNALVHTDASQALGRIPCHFKELGIDFMTLSSLKIGGPAGVGALIAKEKIPLTPLLIGGGQERGKRAGTLNAAGICGFAAALTEAHQEEWQACKTLRDELEDMLLNLTPDAYIFSQDAPRLPNTTCIALPYNRSEKYVMLYDLEGIAISAGSACSSGKIKPSHVLKAMKAPETYITSAIRISLGAQTTQLEIEKFCKVWHKIALNNRQNPLSKEALFQDFKELRRESYVSPDL